MNCGIISCPVAGITEATHNKQVVQELKVAMASDSGSRRVENCIRGYYPKLGEVAIAVREGLTTATLQLF